MGTFDRMQAELHSRWYGQRIKLKENDAFTIFVKEWKVVGAYYSVDEDNPITVAKLVIRPSQMSLDECFDRHVEVNEVERI